MDERDAAPPEIECEQQHASLVVDDVRAAVEFYTTKLGFRVGFTQEERRNTNA